MQIRAFLFLLLASLCLAQPREKGPYTIYPIIPGVMRIEDSNHTNPAGVQFDAQGNRTGFNNCSDMYLIVGTEQALLIDLSNPITWDFDGPVVKKIYPQFAGWQPVKLKTRATAKE